MKGRRVVGAIQSLAPSGKILNPVLSSKLYWSISITSMLYGVEVWPIKAKDMDKFELTHSQMARNLQGLPSHVSGLAARSILGWVSIEAWADMKRLMFLHKTINLSCDNLFRIITVRKLFVLFRNSNSSKVVGPTDLLYRVCMKYDMCNLLYECLLGKVIQKNEWKRIVTTRVLGREHELWAINVHLYSSLRLYRHIEPGISLSLWWHLGESRPDMRDACQSVIIVITGGCVWWSGKKGNECKLCMNEKDSIEHFLCYCDKLKNECEDLLKDNRFSTKVVDFDRMALMDKWSVLLSGQGFKRYDEWVVIGVTIAECIHRMWTKKKSLCR